jgi:hypothetical protein
MRVERTLTELSVGQVFFSPPKSEPGRRVVAIPAHLVPELRAHIERVAQQGIDGLLFTSPTGKPLRNSNVRGRVWLGGGRGGWPAGPALSLSSAYRQCVRGWYRANLRELMERMGHSRSRAAMIYLHSAGERQRKIADALGELAQAELSTTTKPGKIRTHLARTWHARARPIYR